MSKTLDEYKVHHYGLHRWWRRPEQRTTDAGWTRRWCICSSRTYQAANNYSLESSANKPPWQKKLSSVRDEVGKITASTSVFASINKPKTWQIWWALWTAQQASIWLLPWDQEVTTYIHLSLWNPLLHLLRHSVKAKIIFVITFFFFFLHSKHQSLWWHPLPSRSLESDGDKLRWGPIEIENCSQNVFQFAILPLLIHQTHVRIILEATPLKERSGKELFVYMTLCRSISEQSIYHIHTWVDTNTMF